MSGVRCREILTASRYMRNAYEALSGLEPSIIWTVSCLIRRRMSERNSGRLKSNLWWKLSLRGHKMFNPLTIFPKENTGRAYLLYQSGRGAESVPD